MATRKVIEQISARATSDGDGVKLLRVFGGARAERFDPFLMMDEFGSDSADDYIGGFPSHPHRGFQTITYMLQGKMEHRDHLGNVGLISDGDVQWMNAGRGVIHSEMPKQTEGKMRGFQVWLNLPAAEKMSQANYEDLSAKKIPNFRIDGNTIVAISGHTRVNSEQLKGYFQVPGTQPVYLDIHLDTQEELVIELKDEHNALVYVYEGEVEIGEDKTQARAQTLSRTSAEGPLLVRRRGASKARLILLAGTPIKEPIVQYGPFVMNSQQQIEQAISDYRQGRLTA